MLREQTALELLVQEMNIIGVDRTRWNAEGAIELKLLKIDANVHTSVIDDLFAKYKF